VGDSHSLYFQYIFTLLTLQSFFRSHFIILQAHTHTHTLIDV
jgi:hypothetical protein